MTDLRALLGGRYDDVIERAARAHASIEPGGDWPTNAALGGNLTGTRDDEYRAGMREQAAEVLAAVLPDLLADAWDEAVASMRYEDGTPVQLVSVVNPYRPEPTTGRPGAALGPTNSPNPTPSATQPPTEPHNTEGA